MNESWVESDRYEPYVGRWSRLVANEFLTWLKQPRGLRWLDIGCGTGALSHAVLQRTAPRWLVAMDRSMGYLRAARNGAIPSSAGFVAADARAIPFFPFAFDVVVSGLVLNFVADPGRMIAEATRLLRPSGLLALYVWDYAGRMELMRYFWDAAVELDPNASELDEGRRFPICQPEALRDLLERHHLRDIDVRAIDVPTVFRDFEDYWSPFLGGQGPAPGYTVALTDTQRSSLRELLRSRLPRKSDGRIALVARAWAIRGRVATG